MYLVDTMYMYVHFVCLLILERIRYFGIILLHDVLN